MAKKLGEDYNKTINWINNSIEFMDPDHDKEEITNLRRAEVLIRRLAREAGYEV